MPRESRIERAALFPDDFKLHAKLDTGAKTSSINAVDTRFSTRGGASWVSFALTNKDGDKMTLERPLVRTTTIKRHFGNKQKRPVIKLDICVGSIRKVVEVNLVDRTGLNYQLLMGRNFLAKSLLVDSGRTYMTSLDCPGG
ncbi:MAG: ATP-dependent zinc protease [Gammaproteobacteria bacterium]|nr:ATP-dependent zinc protease [Gammaproteobacteria bacterium]